MLYITPEIEIIAFRTDDCITTSWGPFYPVEHETPVDEE